MNFKEKCVFLGVRSFKSKKTSKEYNLISLHLPTGEIQDFFLEDDVFSFLNDVLVPDIYTPLGVDFSVSFYNDKPQIKIEKLAIWI